MYGRPGSRGILRTFVTLLLCVETICYGQEELDDAAFVSAIADGYDSNVSFDENFYSLLGILCPESVYCTTDDISELNNAFSEAIKNDTIALSDDFYTANRTILVSEARLNLQNNAYKLAGYCTPCSCKDVCVERQTCCPCMSKELKQQDSVVTERRIIQKCVYANIKSYSPSPHVNTLESIGLSYYMVTDCFFENVRDDIATKCTLPDQYQPEQTLPVYSPKTARIYKNKFCAECNDDDHVTPWEVVITLNDILSLTGPFVLPSTPEKIYTHLAHTRFLQVFYVPPENTLAVGKNSDCIVSNQVTQRRCKERPNFDSDRRFFLRRACEMYQHKYVTKAMTYNNVFCYLCAQEYVYGPKFVRGARNIRSSYSAILRPGLYGSGAEPETAVTGEQKPCNCTDYYDPLKKTCRQLMCPPGETFIGCGCVEFLQNMTGMTVKLHLDITPELAGSQVEEAFRGQLQQTVINSILTKVKRKLNSLWELDHVGKPFLARETSERSFLKFYYIILIHFKGMRDNRKVIKDMFNALLTGLRTKILDIPFQISLGRIVDFKTFPNSLQQGSDTTVDPLTSITAYLGLYAKCQALNKLVFCKRVKLENDEVGRLQNNSLIRGLSESYLGYVFWGKDGSMCLEDFETAFILNTSGAMPSFRLCMLFDWLAIIVTFQTI